MAEDEAGVALIRFDCDQVVSLTTETRRGPPR